MNSLKSAWLKQKKNPMNKDCMIWAEELIPMTILTFSVSNKWKEQVSK